MKHFSRSQQWILFFVALFILGLLFVEFYDPFFPKPPAVPSKEFVVEVSGDVDRPGIYIFPTPPTLRGAIDRAGGREGLLAHEEKNPSEVLTTGTLLTVSREPDGNVRIRLGRMEARKLLVFSIPLDLNRASVEDLCLLPGIGPSLAREIVTARKKRNGFRTLEELKEVSGIGETKWKTFRPYLTVR
jgi:competence protein ComEA